MMYHTYNILITIKGVYKMITGYYECNHGIVAEIDCRTYLLTEEIIKKYGIKPKFGDGN